MAITLAAARTFIRSHIDKNKSGTIDNTREGNLFSDWYHKNTISSKNFDKKALPTLKSIYLQVQANMYADPLAGNGDGTFKGVSY